jgi:riboflavin biosynthesis pyrimidine reductase
VRQIFPAGTSGHDIATVSRGDNGQPAQAAIAALAELYAYPAPAPGPAVAGQAAPWVRANMVASADGASTVSGRSGGLSGAADKLVFSVLRSLADVILVGAATARAEKYRPAKPGEIWGQLRDGRPATPPIAVVTSQLGLDLDSPLLASAAQESRTIVLTTQQCPDDRKADVIVAGTDRVTPAGMIGALADRGYRRILIEGGPSLLGQVAAAGLLDELCVTVSPVLEGGRAGRIMTAPPEAAPGQQRADGPGAWPPADLALAHILEENGFLLCRYLVSGQDR